MDCVEYSVFFKSTLFTVLLFYFLLTAAVVFFFFFPNGCLCLTAQMSRSKDMIFRKGLFRSNQRSRLSWALGTMKLAGTIQLGKEIA